MTESGITEADILRHCGLKNTKQRAAAIEILEKNCEPLTAEQVFLELRGKGVPVNLSTVYRILEMFVEKGVVVKRDFAYESKAMYEYNRETHKHYLVCLRCRKMQPVSHCPLDSFVESVAKATNYSISGHRMDLYGYCPECMEKEKTADKPENSVCGACLHRMGKINTSLSEKEGTY